MSPAPQPRSQMQVRAPTMTYRSTTTCRAYCPEIAATRRSCNRPAARKRHRPRLERSLLRRPSRREAPSSPAPSPREPLNFGPRAAAPEKNIDLTAIANWQTSRRNRPFIRTTTSDSAAPRKSSLRFRSRRRGYRHRPVLHFLRRRHAPGDDALGLRGFCRRRLYGAGTTLRLPSRSWASTSRT